MMQRLIIAGLICAIGVNAGDHASIDGLQDEYTGAGNKKNQNASTAEYWSLFEWMKTHVKRYVSPWMADPKSLIKKPPLRSEKKPLKKVPKKIKPMTKRKKAVREDIMKDSENNAAGGGGLGNSSEFNNRSERAQILQEKIAASGFSGEREDKWLVKESEEDDKDMDGTGQPANVDGGDGPGEGDDESEEH